MKLDIGTTRRGFGRIDFKDANDNPCSMQNSSAIRKEGLLWLGNDTKNTIQVMNVGDQRGWSTVNLNEVYGRGNVVINDRMHLTQSQVKDMLPYLQYFAEHGELPEGEL